MGSPSFDPVDPRITARLPDGCVAMATHFSDVVMSPGSRWMGRGLQVPELVSMELTLTRGEGLLPPLSAPDSASVRSHRATRLARSR